MLFSVINASLTVPLPHWLLDNFNLDLRVLLDIISMLRRYTRIQLLQFFFCFSPGYTLEPFFLSIFQNTSTNLLLSTPLIINNGEAKLLFQEGLN